MAAPREDRERPPILKISVTGFPDSANRSDLKLLFSNYGTVTVEHMNSQMAVLRFSEPSSVAQVILDKGIYLRGHHLKAQPHMNDRERKKLGLIKRDFTRTKQKSAIIEPAMLELTGDFHSQLDALLTAVRLNQQEVNQLARLYIDIKDVLQEQWPGCVTYPFGSITTGLGIKSSDADCYVSGAGRADQSDISVNKARRLFDARPELFAEILAIPRANTPIVKLFHLPTQTNCDISFKTPLGTHNSKLIAFFHQSDAKLIPISVVIKYWAKIHELTGTGRMSNYALTMLVIFYFQQPPLNILPAVHLMQNITNQCQLVDGWNTAFAELLLPRDYNQQLTIPQLLAGFFHFYAKFDFNKYIVCPFLGRPIEKELFHKFDSIPNEFAIYKYNIKNKSCLPLKTSSAMCIQDPFEQCHNVSSNVSPLLAAEIKAYFEFATETYEKDKQDNCEDFLKHILLEKPSLSNLPVKKKRGKNMFLRLKFKHELNTITNPDWKSVVRKAVFVIFEKMLKIKLTKLGENGKGDRIRDKYKAVITRAVWKRSQFDRLYKFMKFDYLEREERITTEIMQVDKNVIHLPIFIRVYLQKEVKSCQILVKLINKEIPDSAMFKDFVTFGRNVLHNWFTSLLRVCNTNTEYNIAEANGDCDGSSNTSDDTDSENEKEKPKVWYNSKQRETNTRITKTSDANVTKNSDADINIRKNNSDSVDSTKTNEPDNNKAPQHLKINKQNIKKVLKLEGNVSLLNVRKIDPDTKKEDMNEVDQKSFDQVKGNTGNVQVQPGTSKDYSVAKKPNQNEGKRKTKLKTSEASETVTQKNSNINIKNNDSGQTKNNLDNVKKQNESHDPEKKNRNKRKEKNKRNNLPSTPNVSCENSIKLTDNTITNQNSDLVIESTNIIDVNTENYKEILQSNIKHMPCSILKLNSTDIEELLIVNKQRWRDRKWKDPVVVANCVSNFNINEGTQNKSANVTPLDSSQDISENSNKNIQAATKHNNSENDAEGLKETKEK